VTGDERLPGLPEVPTFRESGLTGFNAGYWVGALVPAGTPEAVVEKLSTEIRRIVGTPESRERLMGVGAQPFPSTRQQFGALLADDVERYGKLIRTANIKLE
jgi:tripartite-type tricarboxylate transporter receptor subunit TctC